MVDADEIKKLPRRANPLHPEPEVLARQRVPVVQGIPPELTGLREVVGRDPGHNGRTAIRVQLEQLPVGPDIGAVRCGEDGQVPDDANTEARCLRAQGFPLLEEEELDYPFHPDFRRKVPAKAMQRRWLAQRNVTIKGGIPGPALRSRLRGTGRVHTLHSHEEAIVIQPPALLSLKSGQPFQLPGLRLAEKPPGRPAQERYFPRDDGSIVDFLC